MCCHCVEHLNPSVRNLWFATRSPNDLAATVWLPHLPLMLVLSLFLGQMRELYNDSTGKREDKGKRSLLSSLLLPPLPSKLLLPQTTTQVASLHKMCRFCESHKCPLNKVAIFCQPIGEIHQLVIICKSTIRSLKFKLNRSIHSFIRQSINQYRLYVTGRLAFNLLARQL